MTSRRRSLAELVPTMPGPVRGVLRGSYRAYGRATADLRPLPDFIILGAQKAGTTALYSYLRRHPQITGPSFKEVSFFDRHYARGERWYRAHLPIRRSSLVGEASPSYLFHPLAPARAARMLPDARLIALLRNPVDRAFSHYQHEVAFGREPLSFEDAIAHEDERMAGELERMERDPAYFSHAWWNYTYVSRGRYAEQLERWFAVFPRQQVLVLLTDDLAADAQGTYGHVLEFLSVGQHELPSFPRVFEREYGSMDPQTRVFLEGELAGPNRRLAELLGRDLPW